MIFHFYRNVSWLIWRKQHIDSFSFIDRCYCVRHYYNGRFIRHAVILSQSERQFHHSKRHFFSCHNNYKPIFLKNRKQRYHWKKALICRIDISTASEWRCHKRRTNNAVPNKNLYIWTITQDSATAFDFPVNAVYNLYYKCWSHFSLSDAVCLMDFCAIKTCFVIISVTVSRTVVSLLETKELKLWILTLNFVWIFIAFKQWVHKLILLRLIRITLPKHSNTDSYFWCVQIHLTERK